MQRRRSGSYINQFWYYFTWPFQSDSLSIGLKASMHCFCRLQVNTNIFWEIIQLPFPQFLDFSDNFSGGHENTSCDLCPGVKLKQLTRCRGVILDHNCSQFHYANRLRWYENDQTKRHAILTKVCLSTAILTVKRRSQLVFLNFLPFDNWKA